MPKATNKRTKAQVPVEKEPVEALDAEEYANEEEEEEEELACDDGGCREKKQKASKASKASDASKASKASDVKLKKPLNAFMLYSSDMRAEFLKSGKPKMSAPDTARAIGQLWRDSDAEAKSKYQQMAATQKAAYEARVAA